MFLLYSTFFFILLFLFLFSCLFLFRQTVAQCPVFLQMWHSNLFDGQFFTSSCLFFFRIYDICHSSCYFNFHFVYKFFRCECCWIMLCNPSQRDSSLLQILTTSLSDGNGVIASSFYLISVFKIPDIILVVSLCSKH